MITENNTNYTREKEYVKELMKTRCQIKAKGYQKFSDGSCMYRWLSHKRNLIKIYLKKEKLTKKQQDTIDFFKRVDKILIKSELNEFRKKTNEYIKRIKLLNRNITKEDFELFSDGTDMYVWISKQNELAYNIKKENRKPKEDEMIKLMYLAKIYDALYETYYEKLNDRVNQYINMLMQKYENQNMKVNNRFNDGIDMAGWYAYQNLKLEKDKLTNKKPKPSRLSEMMLLAKIDDTIYELNTKESISKRVGQYEKRVLEYIDVIQELKRNIKEDEDFEFEDGTNMYLWYKSEYYNLTKRMLNEEAMQKAMLFSRILNTLFDIKKNKIFDRIDQYIDKILELNRNIKTREEYKFCDGVNMALWYYNEKKKQEKEIEDNIELSSKRKEEIKMFKKIDDTIKNLK